MIAGVEDEPVDEAAAPEADHAAVGDPPVIVGSGPATASGPAERPQAPITVEQAYLAKLKEAGAAPPPSRPAPPPSGPVPPPRSAPPAPPPLLRARPRIEPEQGILGLSRHTRSRLGARLFNLFFVLVFALIVIQMVVALLAP